VYVIVQLATDVFIEIVKQSQEHFDFEIPSVLCAKRISKFDSKLTNTDNMFCKYLV